MGPRNQPERWLEATAGFKVLVGFKPSPLFQLSLVKYTENQWELI